MNKYFAQNESLLPSGYHSSVYNSKISFATVWKIPINLTWCLGDVKEILSFSPKKSFYSNSVAVFDKILAPMDCQVLCYGSGMLKPTFTSLSLGKLLFLSSSSVFANSPNKMLSCS